MRNKKIAITIVSFLVAGLICLAGCYDGYLLTQKDSLSSNIFVVPCANGVYIVKTKDGNIWYYQVNTDNGDVLKYVIFGDVTTNSLTRQCIQTNVIELEKSK
jgi:hypothetical protein